MVVSFLLACADPASVVSAETAEPAADTDAATEDPLPDTGEVANDPPIDVGTIGDQELDDSWIFSAEVIHEIALELPQATIDALAADPYTYAEASVTIDGEVMDPVGLRLRGKIGSFRDLGGKPKFKIDFNQYVEDQRFYGLETLSLNNSIVDCSYLKEAIGYRMFEAAGVAASRTGFAEVTVNGAAYGLYVVVEVPDDRFLRRHWADPSGRLYDGKYVWYGGYSYTLLDFGDGVDSLFQLEEGLDVGNADIVAVSEAMAASWGLPSWEADMASVIDWDVHHRMWAVEQWIGQNDGYSLNTNNYRVYFDPSDGLADMIPWDLDYSFLYDHQWGLSWSSTRGNLTYGCLQDAACVATHQAVMAEVLEAIEAADPVAQFDAMVAVIADSGASDPRRECATSSVTDTQAYVRGWLEDQNVQMRTWWGL